VNIKNTEDKFMGLQITRSPLSVRSPLQRRLIFGLAGLILIVSLFAAFYTLKAHADIPLYSQETTGFGDRKVIRYNETFALDSTGNIFASMYIGNNTFIRKYAADGTFIKDFRVSDVTGNYTVSYIAQYGHMAVDKNDNLYAINSTDNTIHVFDDNGRYQRTISGAIGNADIAFDSANNYYLTDSANNQVKKFAHDGTFLYSIGSVGSGDGQFNTPREVAIDSHDNVVVTDIGNSRIQIFNATGSFVRKFGQTNSALLCPAQPSLDSMAGLTLDQNDNIYVATHAGWCNQYVQKFANDGTFITTQTRPHYTNFMRFGPNNAIYEIEPGPNANYNSIHRYDTSGTAVGGPLVGDPNALLEPVASAQDSAGNTYVADQSNKRVQKYDSNHNPVLTFGDSALFQTVDGIAVDQNGTVYVSDRMAKKIQKFSSTGTSLGSFNVSSSKDGQFFYGGPTKLAVRPDGNLAIYYGYPYTNGASLQIMTPSGSSVKEVFITDSLWSFAQKSDGSFVLLASHNSYPYGNYLIQYDANGNFVKNLPSTTFKLGTDISYDNLGNLYALGTDPTKTQQYDGSIARLNFDTPELPSYSVVVPIAYASSTIYFTTNNQLLVSDPSQNYVHAYDATILQPPLAPTNLTTATSTPGTLSVNWHAPASGPTPSLYRVEYKPHSTSQWYTYNSTTATNLILSDLLDDTYDVRVTAINDAGPGPAVQASSIRVSNTYGFKQRIDSPNSGHITGVTFDSNGRRYDSDSYNELINVYDASGVFSYSFGTSGSGDGQFSAPGQSAISSDNKLYVPDQYNHRVEVFALDGTYLSSFGSYGTGDGQMDYPSQVYIDSSDNVYVVSQYYNIQKYDKNGNFLGRIASSLGSPTSMTMDNAGNIYVANSSYDANHGIYKYSPAGTQLAYFGSVGQADGQMYDVYSMVINPLGELILNDSYNYRVIRFTTDGTYLGTLRGTYGINGDYLTFDGSVAMNQSANGDLYVANAYSPYTNVFNFAATLPPTSTPPTAPTALVANTTVPNQVKLTWSAPTTDGGSPITSYRVEYKQSSQGTSSWIATTVSSTTLSYTLSNLPAVCHDVRVSAGNSNGYGIPALLSCIRVIDAPTPTLPTTPVSGSSTTSPHQSDHQSQKATPSNTPTSSTSPVTSPTTTTPPTQSTAQPITVAPAKNPQAPGRVTVTWQPPADTPPTGYIVEYRLATIPESDTTTPWRHATTAGSDQHDATITLPAGEYTVRVAAFFPGDQPRIILGVAHITIPAYEALTSGAAKPTKASSFLLVAICIGLVMAAFFILIVVWKRKRRKQATQANLPPHW
jgi:sugar lactone lactonase YvrE